MTPDHRSLGFWAEFLRRTWEPRQGLIDLILDTERVRESWLQADIFLAAKTSAEPRLPYFCCNYIPNGFGGPADWSYWDNDGFEADDPSEGVQPLMVAEVKCLGGDYLTKGFAGLKNHPRRFLGSAAEFPLMLTQAHPVLLEETSWSLVNDYRRLASYQHPAKPLRLLVLILDKRHPDSPLGQCLADVEFERQGTVVLETPMWRCKVWEIQGKG